MNHELPVPARTPPILTNGHRPGNNIADPRRPPSTAISPSSDRSSRGTFTLMIRGVSARWGGNVRCAALKCGERSTVCRTYRIEVRDLLLVAAQRLASPARRSTARSGPTGSRFPPTTEPARGTATEPGRGPARSRAEDRRGGGAARGGRRPTLPQAGEPAPCRLRRVRDRTKAARRGLSPVTGGHHVGGVGRSSPKLEHESHTSPLHTGPDGLD